MASTKIEGPIVFFDGDCGFCSKLVNKIAKRDKMHFLSYAPLKGATAKSVLSNDLQTAGDTVVLYSNGKTWTRSEATIRIGKVLGGCSAVAAEMLKWTPRFLRDAVYRLIASNRHRLVKTTCPLNHSLRLLP